MQNALSKLTFLIVLLAVTSVLFLTTGSTAFADDQLLSPTIDTYGNVSLTCPETGNVTQYIYFRGEYPTITETLQSGTPTTDCVTFFANLPFEGGLTGSNTTPDGEYNLIFQMNGQTDPDYRISATRHNTIWTTNYVSTTTPIITHKTSFKNLTSSLTSTTTIDFDVQFYLDQTEIDHSVSSINPQIIELQWSLFGTTDINKNNTYITDPNLHGLQTETVEMSFTEDGTYDILAKFSNTAQIFGEEPPFPDEYIYMECVVESAGTVLSCSSPDIYSHTRNNSLSKRCSLTNWGACIRELFVPTEAELREVIYPKLDELKYMAPWGYAYRIYEIFATATTTSSTSPISMTFVVPEELPAAGQSLTLNAGQGLQSSIAMISAVRVDSIDGDPWAQFLIYWNRIWWWLFAFWLLTQITGTFGFNFHREGVTAHSDEISQRRKHEKVVTYSRSKGIGNGWRESERFRK